MATTGYVRKYARWLLNHAKEVQQTHGRTHLRRYGPEVQHALLSQLLAMSKAAADRLLCSLRKLDQPMKSSF